MNDGQGDDLIENDPGAAVCPLCGGTNECAMARAVPGDEPCWCEQVRFTEELLASVPAEMRNRACICAACASGKA